jgi:hypothetical protein
MQLVIDSKFRPFSYDELIKPLMQYKEAYDKVEADYSNLAAQTEQWKDIANQTQSPEAYAMYSKYANDLNKVVDDFSKGMTLQNRSQLGTLRRRYASEIIPIAKAATRKRELEEEQRKLSLQDPTRLWQRRASDISLDDFIKNPSLDYGQSYSGQSLLAQSSAIAQNLAKGLQDYGMGKPIDSYTNTFIQRHGLKASDIQEYLAGNPTATSKMLQKIHDQVLASSGISSWKNKEAEAKATSYINQGMWSAIGQSTVQAMENYGARKALDTQIQRDLIDYQNQSKDSDLLPLDKRSLYSPIEQADPTEVETNIKNFKKYFYTKNGKTYLNSAGLKAYNEMLPVGAVQSVKGGYYPSAQKSKHTAFYDFLNKIGAGKYIVNKRLVGPGRIGNLWSAYINKGVINKPTEGDALREYEYNVKIDKSDQNNLLQSLVVGYANKDFSVVKYDRKSGTFKQTDTISGKDIASGKYTPTDIQGSYAGLTVSLVDKNNKVVRVRVPSTMFEDYQSQAVNAYKSARKFSIVAQTASKKLNVSDLDVAKQAYFTGKLYGKPLTEEQRELIRQWNDAEEEYKNHVQVGQYNLSQLNQAIKTKPKEYESIGH